MPTSPLAQGHSSHGGPQCLGKLNIVEKERFRSEYEPDQNQGLGPGLDQISRELHMASGPGHVQKYLLRSDSVL